MTMKLEQVRDWLLARAQDGQMQRSVYTSNYQLREMADAIDAHLLSQEAEIERYKVAWTEYNDRTEWVQKTAKPKELGLHRADVLRLRIESAESRLAAADALLRFMRIRFDAYMDASDRAAIDAATQESTT